MSEEVKKYWVYDYDLIATEDRETPPHGTETLVVMLDDYAKLEARCRELEARIEQGTNAIDKIIARLEEQC